MARRATRPANVERAARAEPEQVGERSGAGCSASSREERSSLAKAAGREERSSPDGAAGRAGSTKEVEATSSEVAVCGAKAAHEAERRLVGIGE
jgi:hypothetical protein